MDPRLLNMYKTEAELVGIEEPRDEIIRRLTDGGSEKALKIVSIVGFGGLGKTAVAKTVHDRLKKQFDCRAFVSVGRNTQITAVLEKLLEKLDKAKYSDIKTTRWDVERLSDELHEFLQHKRFFIVIDDIWDNESWTSILYSLKENNCGSRIIMTTRNSDLVTKGESVYKLQPLSYDNSKALFNKRIQSVEGQFVVDQLDELSDKILRKCDGVPLAIIAIASLLADKPWQEWRKAYDTMVSAHGDSMMEIISYSYEDLPSHLKPCLLYMSAFPEDSIVWKNDLIWMWIGEGFVQVKNEGDSILEQGERYFNELLNRSMIQPIEDNDFSIYAAKVHDIVYDFICTLSREENFNTVSVKEQHTSCKGVGRRKEMGLQCSETKVRRLSLQGCHFECIPNDTLGMPDAVRSLYILDNVIDATPQFYCFLVCRILDIEYGNIPNLKHLGKLLHLRYLEINGTHVDKLPEEIADLKSLQTLLLTDIGPHELPSAICSLTQLMCMHITGFKRLPTNRMGNLVCLEELVLDPVEGRSETDDLVVQLGKLTRLRVLHIKFGEEMEESSQNALVNSLCSLEKLQDLKINFPNPWAKASAAWQGWVPPRQLWRLIISDIMFSHLPAWISPSRLPRLSNLDVRALVVQEQDLENLARLPELCYLFLPCAAIHQGHTLGAAEGFKKLRTCIVGTTLKFLQGGMPSLEVLDFVVTVAGQRLTVDGVQHMIFPTKDVIGDLHDFGLGNLLSLKYVNICVDCEGARTSDVEEVEAAVRRAVEGHSKNPTFSINRFGEEDSNIQHVEGSISDNTEDSDPQQVEGSHISSNFDDTEGCHDDSLRSTIQPSVAEAVHEQGMRRADSMHWQSADSVPQDQ